MRLFATRQSAFAPLMAPPTSVTTTTATTTASTMASLRVPLTSGGGNPIGPPTYETFSSTTTTTITSITGEAEQQKKQQKRRNRKALTFSSTAIPSTSSAGATTTEARTSYARRPFSSPNENGLPLPPPDLKRLQRIIWRRRIFSFFPPMSQKFAERLRLAAPHVLLFIATMVYGIAGAIIIYRIEKPHEQNHIFSHSKAIIDAQTELLHVQVNSLTANSTNATIQEAIDKLISVSFDAFAEGVKSTDLQLLKTNNTRSSRWSFHSALFFTATVLTSIGYGHLVPISTLGRVFIIFYAMIGIPLTLITIADVAKFFSDMITKFDNRRPKSSRSETSQTQNDEEPLEPFQESSFAAKIFVFLLLLIYMIGAALFFWLVKNQWDFVDSIYFCMITLVTIGFGDLVPEDEPHYFGWILFMFAGLILTTLTVDMCGSAGIASFHMLGRVDPRKIFKLFNKSPDKNAFEPHDIRIIPYIDEIIKNYENSVAKMSI